MTPDGEIKPDEVADPAEISDGYHSLSDLYRHRSALFIALSRMAPGLSWRARVDENGEMFPDMFLAGMLLPTGMIAYHMPSSYWYHLDHVRTTLELAPAFDGYTSNDVVERLLAFAP